MTTTLVRDGVALVSRFGVVQPLPMLIHEPDNSRPCVHMTGDMPKVFTVCRGPIERLNFQPRFAADPLPKYRPLAMSSVRPGTIAARREDLLILSAELIGPIGMRHPQRGAQVRDQRIQHHWRYHLHAIDGEPDVLLAVRTDEWPTHQ